MFQPCVGWPRLGGGRSDGRWRAGHHFLSALLSPLFCYFLLVSALVAYNHLHYEHRLLHHRHYCHRHRHYLFIIIIIIRIVMGTIGVQVTTLVDVLHPKLRLHQTQTSKL